MAIDIGTALCAFGIFALALENYGLAVICFIITAWCVS